LADSHHDMSKRPNPDPTRRAAGQPWRIGGKLVLAPIGLLSMAVGVLVMVTTAFWLLAGAFVGACGPHISCVAVAVWFLIGLAIGSAGSWLFWLARRL
jgi:hypothetical protein